MISPMGRGVDGLTSEELRASRRGWWDERFTAVLLQATGLGVERVVDVGCGLAAAAHALLPHLAKASYVGIDVDEARLAEATRQLEKAGLAGRAELRLGRAERLPCLDAEADLVLFAMTLQHLPDVGPALAEARRIIAPGGTLVAAEPDNLGQRFYFDGPLEVLNRALSGLAGAAREARLPADSALGPRAPALLERAGFEVLACTPHCLGGLRRTTAHEVLDAALRVAEITAVAAGLRGDHPSVAAARDAVAGLRAGLDRAATGYGGQLAPVFVTTARVHCAHPRA